MKIYSYARFSSAIQKEGDSLTRQRNLANAWLQRNPEHTLDTTTDFTDQGKSAFKGEHLNEGGKLNLFLKMVDNGKIENGSALMVESFDRLSRLPVTEACELFTGILRRGLTVIFLSPERILTKEIIDANPFNLIEVIISGIRSNEESNIKSKRIISAIQRQRIQTKAGKKILILCPAWCDLVDGKYIANEEKVKVIRRIHEMYISGKGAYQIARVLNEEKVPTFGKGGTLSKKGVSNEWYKLIVVRMLRDERLIGKCKFNECDDYYPRVLDDKTFYLSANRKRNKAVAGRTNNTKTPSNLFRGLTKCSKCGASATRADKFRSGYLHQYFCCENGRTGKGCKYMSFKNAYIEESFFNMIDNDQFYASQTDTKSNEAESIKGKLDETILKRDKYFALIDEDSAPSKMMVGKLKALEAEVESLTEQWEIAKAKKLSVSGISGLCEMKNELNDMLKDPVKRMKIAEYIREVVEKIVIRYHESAFPAYTAYFKSGHIATVTIIPFSNRSWNFQIRQGTEINYNPNEIEFGGEE